MNCIEFLNFISNKQGEIILDSIVDYFDYCMALYSIISTFPYRSIHYIPSYESVEFDITMDNNSINLLSNQIIQNSHTIISYGKRYDIFYNTDNDELLTLTLRESI